MTPREFIAKWRDNPLKERASYQLHFLDLCELLGMGKPGPDTADTYCFERGATRTGAGQGWADVWKRGCFAIEYKAARRNLGEALKQLMTYALALDNPPLLVVCDTNVIEIHTHFTNAPSEVHTLLLEDLAVPANLDKLRWMFASPDKFHPGRTIAQITEEAAGKFAELAHSLNSRGHAPQTVAHFLNQCLFCLFAEDANLLPEKLFERLLDKSRAAPEKVEARLRELFEAMRRGGEFALEDIHWFNGGLFEKVEVLPLDAAEIGILHQAARLDWSEVEPSIFGTLFERGLDPKKRSQLGAHYTDPQSIARIVNPVVVEPLAGEWDEAKRMIETNMARYGAGGKGSKAALQEAQRIFYGYLERLKNFRVLDPACGSGNFLYLALRALKDLEHKANLEAEQLGLQRQVSIEVSPANVLGIELSPYAAELARVTVWIGEIQWMLKNGYPIRKNPILQSLDHIENRDALFATPPDLPLSGEESSPSLTREGRGGLVVESDWPAADAIVGNPPFLGDKKMRGELGGDYTDALRKLYEGRVPGGADLVTYWFEKARAQIEAGKCNRAGLVATNSIRGGANQQVLSRICETTRIFNAWSDEEWVNEGAAVRVSLVCFETVRPEPVEGRVDAQADHASTGSARTAILDGHSVALIHADLTAGDGLDLTQAKPLKENAGTAFQGDQKIGNFDIPGDLARQWLKQPNPNGKPNSEVVKPRYNGQDVTRRYADGYVVDFGVRMGCEEAALYETPFAHVVTHVKPEREKNPRPVRAKYWWLHGDPQPAMRAAIELLPRYIATPETAKHRLFVWLDGRILPDKKLIVVARSDDATFGVLHSRIHEVWALAQASMHGKGNDPRYTPTTTFETFPFPDGLSLLPTPSSSPLCKHPLRGLPAYPTSGGEQISGITSTPSLSREGWGGLEQIAPAARHLNTLRDNWLNPSEWVEWQRTPEEQKAGFPARPVAKAGFEADLKKRTLTNLYNARPAWLDNAHQALDAAVALAYGWADYTPEMPDEELLRRLLKLNLARAG